MKVELITHTPHPEKIVSAAAKLCYSKTGTSDILEGLTDEKIESFIEKLASLGHESPIEHVSYTFAVEGVSRVLTHQLVRHRIASFSQQSQRYVKLNQFEYIMPPMIEKDPRAKKIFIQAMEEDQKHYDALVETLEETYNKEFLSQGLSEKKAKRFSEKKAIEDARFVFPNACETKIILTMNARTLMHFFKHRCCDRAQWEIRDMADKMLSLVKEVSPTLFKFAGPNCVSGPCPEGAMTCGKASEKKAHYLKGE